MLQDQMFGCIKSFSIGLELENFQMSFKISYSPVNFLLSVKTHPCSARTYSKTQRTPFKEHIYRAITWNLRAIFVNKKAVCKGGFQFC